MIPVFHNIETWNINMNLELKELHGNFKLDDTSNNLEYYTLVL